MTTYRTAAGQEVDMAKLALKNEKTRAAGNMGVNARGDIVDSNNQVIANRADQVNKSYSKQSGTVPVDTPVGVAKEQTAAPADEKIEGLDNEVDSAAPTEEPSGGLAGAVKRAKKGKTK